MNVGAWVIIGLIASTVSLTAHLILLIVVLVERGQDR